MQYTQQSLFDDFQSEIVPFILISLREDVHLKILKNQKKYEYRRSFIKTPSKVFIYVTGKVKAICAYAEFGKPIIGEIEYMKTINSQEKNPNPNGITKYFENKKECFAIPIEKYNLINNISLEQLRIEFGEFFPPQSYIFLDKKPELYNYLIQMSGIRNIK